MFVGFTRSNAVAMDQILEALLVGRKPQAIADISRRVAQVCSFRVERQLDPAPVSMMASITNLPKELVLEITKLSTLKDAINLLRTCKTLYEVTGTRPFWTDQLRSLCCLYQPILPLQFNSLTISELRKMATKPYTFEQTVIKRKLRNVSPSRLKPDLLANFADAKIVSGGQWLVTLSTEWDKQLQEPDSPGQTFVRLWQITAPLRKNFTCIASMELPAEHSPMELCLQPGDGPLDLQVFVNVFTTAEPDSGGYIQAFQINLAADDPEFCLLAELKTDRFCSGMILQEGSVLATYYVPGSERVRAFIWNWKTGDRLDVSSEELLGGTFWFVIITEALYVMWNAVSRSVDVHWSAKSDRPDSVDRHLPGLSDTFPHPPQGVQAILPVVDQYRDTYGVAHQVFLTHLEEETLRADIKGLGTGQISFTRYAKDNTYMQDPSDPSDPFGSDFEAPSDFSQTVGGHLVDMSSSGRITVYFTSDSEETTKVGESMSYLAFRDFGDRASETHCPFMCPFSGVVGTVSQSGDFYIWRMR